MTREPSARRLRELSVRIGIQVATIAQLARDVLEASERTYGEAYWPGRGGDLPAVGRGGAADPTGRAALDGQLAYVRGTLRLVERRLRAASRSLEEAEQALATCWQETDAAERDVLAALDLPRGAEMTD